MNCINKIIIRLIFEIFIISIILVGSVFVWNDTSHNTSYAQMADYYSSESYKKISINKIQDMDLNHMTPIDDACALKKKPTIITFHNNSKYKVEYYLYLKISKKSTLNINKLKININGNTMYLKNNIYENEVNYYYLIDNNNTKFNRYVIRLWLDESADNSYQNKTLIYDFIYEEDEIKN